MLLDDPAVLPLIQPELREPVRMMLHHLETTGLHSLKHLHNASLDTDALVFKLGVLVPHVEALRPILRSKWNDIPDPLGSPGQRPDLPKVL